MRKLVNFIAMSTAAYCLAFSSAHSAENLRAATAGIAKHFADSIPDDAAPIRIGITAFVQSDLKTTAFTSALMSQLSGQMVKEGKGKFRVIERRQLEKALFELELAEDEQYFDRENAKKLGNFLGVDALIVGDIILQYNIVELDARLIEIESLETTEHAAEWVPKTPTVQRWLATPVHLGNSSAGEGAYEDIRDGLWRGTGVCGDLTIGLTVSMRVSAENQISALQTYFPAVQQDEGSSLEPGVFLMTGKIDPSTNEFSLEPGEWVYRPSGHVAVGFSGKLEPNGGVLNAQYDQEGCGAVKLRKVY